VASDELAHLIRQWLRRLRSRLPRIPPNLVSVFQGSFWVEVTGLSRFSQRLRFCHVEHRLRSKTWRLLCSAKMRPLERSKSYGSERARVLAQLGRRD
jgi:hypothetical protein